MGLWKLAVRMSMLLTCLLVQSLAATAVAQERSAATWPTHPVRLVVPFPPGASPNDIIGRLIARQWSEGLGQQVVVDNRAGAGGTIGTEQVTKSNPDGYTLLISSTTITTSPNLYKSLGYDVARDLQPITMVAAAPMLLYVHPSVPAKTAKEFLAYAKSKPGELNFGSGGNGTVPHFAGEMLKSMTGIQMQHVPYKGGSPAVAALLAGEVKVFIDTPTATLGFAKQGKLRVLAVAEKKRIALLPDLPTLDESGVPGFEMRIWYGFFAPAKTPQAIVARLHAETVKALGTEEVKSRLTTLGTEAVGNPPEVFQPLVRSELERWRKVAREAGIKPE
ncbi:MAG: tripartite tricarboxylate transporter substrate binding protein [Betaproteobacteria bacterium]|nr:tripartite tricarboxylate transporter substrate binding protein [Betaproteobacteria bacterium]